MFLLSKTWWDFSRRWHNWVKSNQCSVSLPFRIATHAAPWRILKTVCLIQKCPNNYKRFRLEKDSFWHGMPVQIIALEVIYSLKITDTGLTLLPKPLGMGGVGVCIFLLKKAYSGHARGLNNFKSWWIKNAPKTTARRFTVRKNMHFHSSSIPWFCQPPSTSPFTLGRKLLK